MGTNGFAVVAAGVLAADVKRHEIVAPRIAAAWQPGQFVIVRPGDASERIPITINDVDRTAGTITIVVQAIGKTTTILNRLDVGDRVADVVGPLGTPSAIERHGTAVVVGGGVGTAIAFPVARALAEAGNHVIAIVGGRDSAHAILERELREVVAEVYPCTDDGSHGHHGFVTEVLEELLAERTVDHVTAVGPIAMMQAVAGLTAPLGIPTVASLNPIMVDGTGMCGGCRVTVGGQTRFACVDGPEFDAHAVDFTNLAQRNRAYAAFERCKVLEVVGA